MNIQLGMYQRGQERIIAFKGMQGVSIVPARWDEDNRCGGDRWSPGYVCSCKSCQDYLQQGPCYICGGTPQTGHESICSRPHPLYGPAKTGN